MNKIDLISSNDELSSCIGLRRTAVDIST